MLFYGFDNLIVHAAQDQRSVDAEASWTYDNLIRLAEALGVLSLENPEASRKGPCMGIEPLLDLLDDALGFRVDFPNPFPGEVGLQTSRGLCSFRAPQALFQAWRIASLLDGRMDARVLEIGPGLGRTAYYAMKLGLRDYTLIDIPLSGAAQGYYLGRVLGEQAVRLFGETQAAPIAIAPPSAFLKASDRYDLVVNVDSLTEMARPTADAYWAQIRLRAPMFLSINHEHNPFRIRDIYGASGKQIRVQRTPYWMRRGYVEEVVRF